MADDSLILVHLSDIHFRCWSGTEYDVDNDIRNELMLDAARVSGSLGQPQGILVAGDIAFSGDTQEYQAAKAWLFDFCDKLGRTLENVWCVPGNHDVDRSQIKNSPILSSIHTGIRQSAQKDIDEQIRLFLDDPEAATIIFRPVTEYNKFAAAFGCQTKPGNTSWQRRFSLNGIMCSSQYLI